MKTRPLILISFAVMAAMAIFALLTLQRLPAGTELPVHWNAMGQPDDWAPALQALLIPIGVLGFVTLVFAVIPWLEPLQDKLDGSAPVLRATWGGMILLSIVIMAVIGLPGWGIDLSVNAIILGIGLLFLILGNALPKSRPGFFVGIRTPWTITDTDNWIATHRLVGKLMMAAGAAIVIAAMLRVPSEPLAVIVLVATLGSAFVPIVYSWWFWHSGKRA